MNALLGAVIMMGMILITGSFVRGGFAFLLAVFALAAFRRINYQRCQYCSQPLDAKESQP